MATASSFVAPVAAKAVNEKSVAITIEAMATDVFARMFIAVLHASPTDIPAAFCGETNESLNPPLIHPQAMLSELPMKRRASRLERRVWRARQHEEGGPHPEGGPKARLEG